MKKTAEDYLGEPVTSAVITVPAYFNVRIRLQRRWSYRGAGEVKRIINEPTAAALACGLDKSRQPYYAVYDLGGVTFDISIIEIDEVDGEKTFEVLANGDTHTGGEYDTRRSTTSLTSLRRSGALTCVTSHSDAAPETAEKARNRAVFCAANRREPAVHYRECHRSKHMNIKVTRAKLESTVEDLVNRSIDR